MFSSSVDYRDYQFIRSGRGYEILDSGARTVAKVEGNVEAVKAEIDRLMASKAAKPTQAA